MENTETGKAENRARMGIVRRARKLLEDMEEAELVLSLVSGGGKPHVVIHPRSEDCEGDGEYASRPRFHDLGQTGAGDMIAL